MNKKKIIKWILLAPVAVIAFYLIGGFFHLAYPLALMESGEKESYTYSLEVIFEKDINYQEAKEIIKSYSLEFNKEYDYTSSADIGERDYINRGLMKAKEGKKEEDFNRLHRALVDIPKGEEKEWKQKLVADSKIEDAIIVPIPVEPSQSIFQKTIARIKLFILYVYGAGFIIGDIVFQNKTPQSIFFSYLLFFLIITLLIIWIIKRKSKDKKQD